MLLCKIFTKEKYIYNFQLYIQHISHEILWASLKKRESTYTLTVIILDSSLCFQILERYFFLKISYLLYVEWEFLSCSFSSDFKTQLVLVQCTRI